MTTFYCDIDEFGTATSSLHAGITTLDIEQGTARDTFFFVFSALAVSAAVASSSVVETLGFNAVSSGHATSALIASNDATNIALSSGHATSSLDRDVAEIVLSQGSGVSALVDSRESLSSSSGAAQSALVALTQRQQLVVETGIGASALLQFNESLAVSAGSGASTLVASTARSSLAVSAGVAQSVLLAGADADALLVSAGEAQSAVFALGSYADLAAVQAVARSIALLPVATSAWVTNTETMAMTRYTGLKIGSMAAVGGQLLALGEGGLFQMTGTTDDGERIRPSIKTGLSQLGAAALKQLGDIVISYVCAGTMMVRISTYGDKTSGTWAYRMPPREAAAPRANRLTPGKGLRGRYFRFEFTTEDGAAFDVDTVVADVAVNNRRI